MRINLRGLCRLAQTILGYGSPPRASPGVSPGTSPGARLLSPGSVAAMLRPRWLRGSSWAGGPANAEPGTERTLATGLGLVLSSRKAGEKPLWGHHGSAYGFLGGIYFDTKAGWGYAYMIGGTSRDPEAYCPGPGALNHWEARLRSRVEKLIPWT